MVSQAQEHTESSKRSKRSDRSLSAKESLVEQLEGWSEKMKDLSSKSESLDLVTKPIISGIDSVNNYLSDRELGDMSADLVGFVRRNPIKIASTIIGGGIGYVLAGRFNGNSGKSSKNSNSSGKKIGKSASKRWN